MNDVMPVAVVDGAGERLDQFGRGARRPRGAVEPLLQAAALDELQRQVRVTVVFADVVDPNDVGMLELRDGLGLPAEAPPLLRGGRVAVQDHLQGDRALEVLLPGPVDDPHAAPPQLGLDREAGDLRQARRAAGQLLGQVRKAPAVFLEIGVGPAVAALVVFRQDQLDQGRAVVPKFRVALQIVLDTGRPAVQETQIEVANTQVAEDGAAQGRTGRRQVGIKVRRRLIRTPGGFKAAADFGHGRGTVRLGGREGAALDLRGRG